MDRKRERAQFSLTVEGEDIEPGKVAFRDLARLSELVQQGLERTARVLSGLPGSAPGKAPKLIEEVTRLALTGIEKGSAVLACELLEPTETAGPDDTEQLPDLPARDLGFRAMDRFVRGLHAVEESPDTGGMPEGWDSSVVAIAQDLADVAAERKMSLTFDARPPELAESIAKITPLIARRLKQRRSVAKRRRVARGRLVLVDLGTGRVDVQEATGGRVSCHFGETLEAPVKRLLGTVVIASGEADFDEVLNKFGQLELDAIEGATEQMGLEDLFWANPSAEEQAAQQGVGPIESIDELTAPGVFTDEDFAGLLAEIRERRA